MSSQHLKPHFQAAGDSEDGSESALWLVALVRQWSLCTPKLPSGIRGLCPASSARKDSAAVLAELARVENLTRKRRAPSCVCRCNSHDTQAMVRCLAQSVLPRHLRSAVQGDLRRFFSGCLLAGALKTLSHLRKLHVQVVGASEAGSVGLAFAFHIGSRLQTNFPRGSESLQIDFRNLGPLDLICCRFIVCVMCFLF